MRKILAGFGVALVVAGIYSRLFGTLQPTRELLSYSDTLSEDIYRSTGKHPRYFLSLSYERSRFTIDDATYTVVRENPDTRRQVDRLQMGDGVTVWYPAAADGQTYSYSNNVPIAGLTIAGQTVISPKSVDAERRSDWYWQAGIGLVLILLSVGSKVYSITSEKK